MASGGNRIDVTLDCEQCKSRNYKTEKNRSNTPERLERRAFCRRCGMHTLHKESR